MASAFAIPNTGYICMQINCLIETTVRATKSGRDSPLERKSLFSKIGDRYF